METPHWNQLQDSELNITSTKIHALRPVYRRQHNCASDYARNVDRVFVKESFHSLIIAFLESCGTAWLASQLLEHGMRMRTHSSSTRRQRISLQPSQLWPSVIFTLSVPRSEAKQKWCRNAYRSTDDTDLAPWLFLDSCVIYYVLFQRKFKHCWILKNHARTHTHCCCASRTRRRWMFNRDMENSGCILTTRSR